MAPTISIVEGIWNLTARFLEYNLATLTRQTQPPLEIMVVNSSPHPVFYTEAEAVCAKYPSVVRMVAAPLTKFNLSRMFNIGIGASRGEYTLLTGVDYYFGPDCLSVVHGRIGPNIMLGSAWGALPAGFDLGDENTLSARWSEVAAKAAAPVKYSPGAMICVQKTWLEKVHGYDETRTPYNYCDADLTFRGHRDGLNTGMLDKWQNVLHISHPYKDELYYGCGGALPTNDLPMIRNPNGWGQP